MRKAFVEKRGDGAVQQRVAEEFEPFVVRRAEAAVRERLEGEVRVGELVAEPRLELGEVRDFPGAAAEPAAHLAVVTLKSRQAEMLLTSGIFTDQLADTTVSPPSLPISRSSPLTAFTSSIVLRVSKLLPISRTLSLRSPACSIVANIFFTEK